MSANPLTVIKGAALCALDSLKKKRFFGLSIWPEMILKSVAKLTAVHEETCRDVRSLETKLEHFLGNDGVIDADELRSLRPDFDEIVDQIDRGVVIRNGKEVSA